MNRIGRSSFVLCSNPAVDGRHRLVHEPILGSSAVNRPANLRWQIVIEGNTYSKRSSPFRVLTTATNGN